MIPDLSAFQTFLFCWILLALVLVPLQLWITAPYGRHASSRWGMQIGNRLGWVLMEILSPLVFGGLFLCGSAEKTSPMWVFFFLWMFHYVNRSLVYPFRTRTRGKKMPLLIVCSAIIFNVVNAGTNGLWLGTMTAPYAPEWITDPRFIGGAILFVAGLSINWQSDHILLNLRKPGETGYRIPEGGFFRLVSCPNHLGEIVEWTGFALMCWNLPAAAFAIWTAANLIPRALAHHRWYRTHFGEYPPGRKAVLPYIL